ncbi:hypothetical protein QQF64_006411 [Cirrhinus molitorella]|uniref:Uncharacterized protein n=1 Tax=Cirrhinus molitorella TaxID=172907 RepID=A0ABR3MEY9_9TELE
MITLDVGQFLRARNPLCCAHGRSRSPSKARCQTCSSFHGDGERNIKIASETAGNHCRTQPPIRMTRSREEDVSEWSSAWRIWLLAMAVCAPLACRLQSVDFFNQISLRSE